MNIIDFVILLAVFVLLIFALKRMFGRSGGKGGCSGCSGCSGGSCCKNSPPAPEREKE